MKILIQEKVICLGKNEIKHLPEKEIDKLIQEEPYITIRGYLDLLSEIDNIENSN